VMGVGIDVGAIDVDAYLVGAETDHLTPWPHCYRSVHMLGGTSRFVLSSSGHIAAIINPPGNPRARYHVGEENPPSAEEWLQTAVEHQGTWWEDWAAWLSERSGPLKRAPRRLGSRAHKVVGPAPGAYVLERAVG
jgi:polyhydroxyalkanoate synthase